LTFPRNGFRELTLSTKMLVQAGYVNVRYK